MNWREVVTVLGLVAGAVVAGIYGQSQLAGVLAGAAAGMATPRALPSRADVQTIAPVLGAIAGGGVAHFLSVVT